LIKVASDNAIGKKSSANLNTFRQLKLLVWFQERIRPTDLQATLIWAGIIGFCGGVCSILFRVATSFVHKVLTGSSEPGLVESFSQLPPLLRLGVPAIGGLVAGAIIQFGTRLRGQVTTTDYMEAVVLVMEKLLRGAHC
jgi:chloride channel protein, CIC family